MFKKIITAGLILIIGISSINIISAQEDTGSDSVREKVKEKIEGVLKNPRAYLGIITDKTGDTLQIKNLNGEIQFISVVPDNVNFVSVGTTSKAIKSGDVGLGDFIVAMGFQKTDGSNLSNGNQVLEARRILVTDEVKPTERKIIFGNVINIEKKILTLNSDNQEMQFEFPRTWKGPEIDEISENDRVVIVSIPDDEKTIIRTIEIIDKSPTPTPEE
jgi:hypothetical protein